MKKIISNHKDPPNNKTSVCSNETPHEKHYYIFNDWPK